MRASVGYMRASVEYMRASVGYMRVRVVGVEGGGTGTGVVR